jgi:hypothetical protein
VGLLQAVLCTLFGLSVACLLTVMLPHVQLLFGTVAVVERPGHFVRWPVCDPFSLETPLV